MIIESEVVNTCRTVRSDGEQVGVVAWELFVDDVVHLGLEIGSFS